MKIKRLTLGRLETNVYLLLFDSEAFVIDPASEPARITEAAEGKPITKLFLTHGHFDHCNACSELIARGAKAYISKTDYNMIKNGFDLARYAGEHFNDFTADDFLSEGTLNTEQCDIRVIFTPGHTAGSVTFIIGKDIFCGDLLFKLGVGRCDLPTGNKEKLAESVKKLYALDGEFTVHPGHGAETTLEFERKNNFYVKA